LQPSVEYEAGRAGFVGDVQLAVFATNLAQCPDGLVQVARDLPVEANFARAVALVTAITVVSWWTSRPTYFWFFTCGSSLWAVRFNATSLRIGSFHRE